MKIRMLQTAKGSPNGIDVFVYEAGQKYDVPESLGKSFIGSEFAEEDKEETIEVKNETKTEDTPEPRARKPKRGKKSSKS